MLPRSPTMPADEGPGHGPQKSPVIQSSSARILKRDLIRVYRDGELVKAHLGNVTITLDYPTAAALGQLLALHARQARNHAGDSSRLLLATGELTDGVKNYAEAHKKTHW